MCVFFLGSLGSTGLHTVCLCQKTKTTGSGNLRDQIFGISEHWAPGSTAKTWIRAPVKAPASKPEISGLQATPLWDPEVMEAIKLKVDRHCTHRLCKTSLVAWQRRPELHCFRPREGGLLPEKSGRGVRPLYQTLPLFITKISNFPYPIYQWWPIYDLTKNLIPYLYPDTLLVTEMAAKWLKAMPYLWPKGLKNHTLWVCTYLHVYTCSSYKGIPGPLTYPGYKDV